MSEGEAPQIERTDQTHTAINRGGQIGRRPVLKALGYGGASVTAAAIGESKLGTLSKLFQPDTENIRRDIPPQLEGKDIPFHNEHYRSPLDVVRQGIENYAKGEGTPFYRRPDYYISTPEAIRNWAESGFKLSFDTQGEPYDAAMMFSAITFLDATELFDYDPGTSFRSEAELRLQFVQDKEELIEGSSLKHTKSTTVIAQAYLENFNRAKEYIDTIRNGDRVSSSELLTYYLKHNQGDIVKSLWDTTLFFKLASRVNLEKLREIAQGLPVENTIINEASREGAELIASLFYDDFSSEVPLEWLISEIPASDTQLNAAGRDEYTEWKDFMPINRSGTNYHIYNIATWGAIMDPNLAETFTTAYYADPRFNVTNHQGKIKVRADMEAIHQVRYMRSLYNQYQVD